jgi:hypothetical protein
VGIDTGALNEAGGQKSGSGGPALKNTNCDTADSFDAARSTAHRSRTNDNTEEVFGFGGNSFLPNILACDSEDLKRRNKISAARICGIASTTSFFEGRRGHAAEAQAVRAQLPLFYRRRARAAAAVTLQGAGEGEASACATKEPVFCSNLVELARDDRGMLSRCARMMMMVWTTASAAWVVCADI